MTHLNRIILDLGNPPTPINTLQNQKSAVCLRMKNPHELEVRRYADGMIKLNKYLSVFSGSNSSDKNW